MSAKTISLTFAGYYRDVDTSGIPNQSGVYLVYTCTYDRQRNEVALRKLIYVGEAAHVRDRIQHHERRPTWQTHLGPGEELCYSFAPIASPDRERAEAAVVYHHKPPVNDEYKYSFPFDDTTMNSSGRCAFIDPLFTVRRTG
jgi:hypothetical protein